MVTESLVAYQRVRDPLHDLVEFYDQELDRALWEVMQTRPFQRLRRVKQLGFSDLVIPVQRTLDLLIALACSTQLAN